MPSPVQNPPLGVWTLDPGRELVLFPSRSRENQTTSYSWHYWCRFEATQPRTVEATAGRRVVAAAPAGTSREAACSPPSGPGVSVVSVTFAGCLPGLAQPGAWGLGWRFVELRARLSRLPATCSCTGGWWPANPLPSLSRSVSVVSVDVGGVDHVRVGPSPGRLAGPSAGKLARVRVEDGGASPRRLMRP